MEKRFISYDVDNILQVSVLSYSHHGPALTVDRTALSSPSPSFSQCLTIHKIVIFLTFLAIKWIEKTEIGVVVDF
ncbi:hypothetical protein ACF0H5_013691 [Mactra antiquata]